MPRNHTPTPEIIYSSAITAFKNMYDTTLERIKSKSRETKTVVPSEVSIYLMQTQGLMTVSEIAAETEYEERWIKKCIKLTRERARVDVDLHQRIKMAEMLIIKALLDQ